MSLQDGDRILVFGATGQQGRAVVDALLEKGRWPVRAATRDPQGEKAQALKARGIEVVTADMDDPKAVDAAMDGVRGVFSIQVVPPGPQAAEADQRQGIGVIDAARKAGVQHLVYTTSAAIGKRVAPGGGEEPKAVVERYLRESGVPFTIVRPTSFMENLNRLRSAIEQGSFAQAMAEDAHQDYISVIDIGRVVAEAFARPQDFLGQTVELAGDRLTQRETAEVLGRVLGRSVAFSPIDRSRLSPFYASFLEWMEKNDGYGVPTPDAVRRRWGVPLMTLEQWLRSQGWGK